MKLLVLDDMLLTKYLVFGLRETNTWK